MKNIKIASVIAALVFIANAGFAQETEGLIPRMMKRFKKPESAKATAASAAQPAKKAVSQQPMSTAARDAANAYNKGKAATPVNPVLKTSPLKTMTKEELVLNVNSELDDEEEILDVMPEIRKVKEENGKHHYIFNDGVNFTKIEDLEKEKLEKLLGKIYNQATMIQTERVNRQLETIRNIQNVQNQLNAIPKAVPTVPSVPQQPPQVPAVASQGTPAQPPRTPPSAPAIPPRR